MNEETNITIVISNYNYAMFVNSAIESCLAQTVPCKIIVVDDFSGDNSWKVICGYAQRENNISGVRLRENSRGNARGKNMGICMSDSEFVVCLDSDDMLLPWSLKSRIDAIRPDDDFIHGWAKAVESCESYSAIMVKHMNAFRGPAKYKFKPVSKMKEKTDEVRWTWDIQASAVLTRRSMYDKYGLYDEDMMWSIDREMWWRCLSHGAKRNMIPKYVSIYRNHSRQITRNPARKNPKKRTQELIARKTSRIEINSNTTLLIPDYDYGSFIDCVV